MNEPFEEYTSLADLFRKLASPVRLALIAELDDKGERCVHELVDALDISQPLVSQHLKILRDARIVKAGRRGREMVYTLADEHVTTILRDGIVHTREQCGIDDEK